MAWTYLRPIRLGNLSVSYSIEYGECKVCCVCGSEERCSSVAAFWQREDEDVLKLLLLLAMYGSRRCSGRPTPRVSFRIGLTLTRGTGRRRAETCKKTSCMISFQKSSKSRRAKAIKALELRVGRLLLPRKVARGNWMSERLGR